MSIFQAFLMCFKIICVVIGIAYFFTRNRFFVEVLEHHPIVSTHIILVMIFGCVLIYGLWSGGYVLQGQRQYP